MASDVKDPLIGMEFEDENHQMHKITERLSAGGQGVVYRTQDPNVLIKLKIVKDEATGEETIVEGEKEYNKYVKELLEVRILDIPKGVNIAKPVLFLKSPQCGYIMRTLDDMVPVQKLMYTNKTFDPLNEYQQTGGLKRRVELLAKFAKMFALLHSRPLIYADLSEGNLFVSGSVDANEAWLIDADNLKHRINFKQIVGTKGYQAPEIASGQSVNTTYSDVYSFAIIAYKMLTYRTSPFLGALQFVDAKQELDENDGWDDDGWDDDKTITDPDTLADLGQWPWVDDPLDDSNRNRSGFDIKKIASPRMYELFRRTFSEEGRHNPSSRPTMEEWYEVLKNAKNAIVNCANCGGSHFFTELTCPFCSGVPKPVYVCKVNNLFDLKTMLADDENLAPITYETPEEKKLHDIQIGWKVIEIGKKGEYLTNIELTDAYLSDSVEPMIEIDINRTVIIRNVSNRAFFIKTPVEGKILQPHTSMEVSSADNLQIISYLTNVKSRKITFMRRG